MEELREVSVRELVNMYVAISYLQEHRIIEYGDIYDYIYNYCMYCDVDFSDLIEEAQNTFNELISDGTLSYIYKNVQTYRINNKIDVIKLASYDEHYLKDMNEVFWGIIGLKTKVVKLTLSNTKKKNRSI